MRVLPRLFPVCVVLCGCGMAEIGENGAPIPDGTPAGTQTAEVCDGHDNDGDGQVDEGCSCRPGQTQPCYPGPKAHAGVGLCTMGSHTCEGDEEFGIWGPCTGAGKPAVEICGNGIDDDCDGEDLSCGLGPDAGPGVLPVCTPGQKQACYSGPAGTAGKGLCKAGQQSCLADGTWSACAGELTPKPEVCNNWIDENCDGQDQLCPGTTAVTLNLLGDCLTVSCPPSAPFPVGCNVLFVGGDSRGCVANAPGSPVVYFQEGDVCSAGYLSGTLLCSSVAGGGLNVGNCPINKPVKYYPTSKLGCPKT